MTLESRGITHYDRIGLICSTHCVTSLAFECEFEPTG